MKIRDIFALFKKFGRTKWEKKQRELAKIRHFSRSQFTDYFSEQGITQTISGKVFDSLVRFESLVEEFTPSPDDSLKDVYGLEGDDLDDFSLNVLKVCACRIPSPSETKVMPPVNDVTDLVKFVFSFRSTPGATA